jgi:ribosome-associated heat shock protein Hsp15
MAQQVRKPASDMAPVESQRLDKWLWFARVARTRTLAAGLVADGRVRVNRVRTTKPAQLVKIDDVITVSVARGVRVIRILGAGSRRGPAPDAASLFEEIVPLQSAVKKTQASPSDSHEGTATLDDNGAGQGGPVSEAGSGRPTKKDRRTLDRLRTRDVE